MKNAHDREMNMNAHIAWALAFWGSGATGQENLNPFAAIVCYYYSAFHAAFALVNTDPGIEFAHLRRMTHSKLETLLGRQVDSNYVNAFKFLRSVRERLNYLGTDDGEDDQKNTYVTKKLQIVRGHPFGWIEPEGGRISFFESIEHAQAASHAFVIEVVAKIEVACEKNRWRGPRRGSDEWLDDYLQEDLFCFVLPRGEDGRAPVLSRGFSILGTSEPPPVLPPFLVSP